MSNTFEDTKRSIEEIFKIPTNDLLIIRGSWGVGKTYFWNDLVKRVADSGQLPMAKYAYVSLFGANDIASVKNQIVVSALMNKIGRSDEKKRWQFFGNTNVIADVKKLAAELPYIKWLPMNLANEGAFMWVSNCIVCIDDIERKDEKLKIKEVLGLAALLKEQKGCKVIFILNQDVLAENEKEEFDSYNEKLVDWSFEFDPSPESVFEYVFPRETPDFEFIRERSFALGIRNVRILKRVSAFLIRIRPFFTNVPKEIRLDLIRSLILFVWIEFDREKTRPNFEFLLPYVSYLHELRSSKRSDEVQKQEDEFHRLLERYGYKETDDVDRVLIRFIRSGVIDASGLEGEIGKRISRHTERENEDKYRSAWDLYRHRFGDNQAEFTEKIVEAFRLNIKRLGISDLMALVEVLRHFKHDSIATELVNEYFQNVTPEQIYEWRMQSLMNVLTDSEILAKISQIETDQRREKPTFTEAMLRVNQATSVNEILSDEREALASEPTEKYYQYFKTYEGDDLYYLVAACLSLDESKPQTIEALKLISKESSIDALRVKRLYQIGAYEQDL